MIARLALLVTAAQPLSHTFRCLRGSCAVRPQSVGVPTCAGYPRGYRPALSAPGRRQVATWRLQERAARALPGGARAGCARLAAAPLRSAGAWWVMRGAAARRGTGRRRAGAPAARRARRVLARPAAQPRASRSAAGAGRTGSTPCWPGAATGATARCRCRWLPDRAGPATRPPARGVILTSTPPGGSAVDGLGTRCIGGGPGRPCRADMLPGSGGRRHYMPAR